MWDFALGRVGVRVVHCVLLFLFAYSLGPSVARGQSRDDLVAAEAESDANVAVRFESEDGSSVELMPRSAGSDLLMHVVDPGVVEMSLIVPSATNAQPVQMNTKTMHGAQPLTLLGVGPSLYGVVKHADGSHAFQIDAQGVVKLRRDGRTIQTPDTAADIELQMMAEEFSAQWAAIRQAKVTMVNSNTISIAGANATRVFNRSGLVPSERHAELSASFERHQVLVNDLRKLMTE